MPTFFQKKYLRGLQGRTGALAGEGDLENVDGGEAH